MRCQSAKLWCKLIFQQIQNFRVNYSLHCSRQLYQIAHFNIPSLYSRFLLHYVHSPALYNNAFNVIHSFIPALVVSLCICLILDGIASTVLSRDSTEICRPLWRYPNFCRCLQTSMKVCKPSQVCKPLQRYANFLNQGRLQMCAGMSKIYIHAERPKYIHTHINYLCGGCKALRALKRFANLHLKSSHEKCWHQYVLLCWHKRSETLWEFWRDMQASMDLQRSEDVY